MTATDSSDATDTQSADPTALAFRAPRPADQVLEQTLSVPEALKGHVMVVPYSHLDELRKLPTEAANEMIALSQRMESALRALYRPDGVNLGMNIGKAAGAGIAGHIHMHVLPRWVADANFMSVVGETRVLPEMLDDTWAKIKAALT